MIGVTQQRQILKGAVRARGIFVGALPPRSLLAMGLFVNGKRGMHRCRDGKKSLRRAVLGRWGHGHSLPRASQDLELALYAIHGLQR